VCGCPAAAQITSYFSSQVSTTVRIGAGCPTGPTPPIAWPVQARTEQGRPVRAEHQAVRDRAHLGANRVSGGVRACAKP
jgi:hypothetical protein